MSTTTYRAITLIDSGQSQKEVTANDALQALESTIVAPPINAQTGTAYTLALTDAGKTVTLANAGAITLTVPDNADVALPVGAQILIVQTGAGQVTVAEDTAVTVHTPETLKLRTQYAQAVLIKIATDEWLLEGNLEAAP